MLQVFINYNPCSDNFTIQIIDGSLSKVVGTGFVVISKNLTLDSVLLVPNLDCNLLLVGNALMKRCVTKFFPNHCEFQDLDLGKMIGSVEMFSELYILKVNDNPEGQPQKALCKKHSLSISSSNNDSVIMLWHYHLGHPSFMYLKQLFPSLFNKDSKVF